MYDKFLIAPFESGLHTDLKPWQITQDAFAELNNAYVFRGRIRKRFGTQYTGNSTTPEYASLNSRLRINLGNTDGVGNIGVVVPGAIFKIGQMFSIGNYLYTVVTTGAPGNLLRSDGVVGVATYNTTTGALVINGSPAINTAVFFYPAEPVMGLAMFEEGAIGNQTAFAFDTQFSYRYAGGSWPRLGTTVWHSSNLEFFWECNWRGASNATVAMFVTNFNATIGAPAVTDDPIYYYTTAGGNWTAFTPVFVPGHAAGEYQVNTARIIVAFKNRLLLLNTIESANSTTNVAHPNRCRYSQNGSPLATAAFYEANQTGYCGGGYIDAPTKEEITSAEFIKDRLIVYFERSTWELAYTGNEALPFVWQKLNTELGSEATFSTVPFDKVTLTVGNTGIHACNGSNVERIDSSIPDEIFKMKNKNDDILRIAGIRDYYTEMVYWSFPIANQASTATYPTRVLVYNYKNNTWAYNDDCFTAFGYCEQYLDKTWENTSVRWQDAGFIWSSGIIQSQFRQVIAGNQQGFVLVINSDIYRNASAMQITGFTTVGINTHLTIVDHTLQDDEFIKIENCLWTPASEPTIDNQIFQVTVIDKDTISIGTEPYTNTYLGRGTVARVSNVQILSKQWNPYVKESRNVALQKIVFCVGRTSHGQVTVDYYASSNNAVSLLYDSWFSTCALGTNVLETTPYAMTPLESGQQRLWHPVYFLGEGQNVQIYISMSDEQMVVPNIVESNFELEGLILFTRPTSDSMI